MSRHVLVVCTANVCRSPMAAGLLQRHLDEGGVDVSVTSAGTRLSGRPVDPVAVAVGADLGVDISGRVPRQFDRAILDADGADLVLTMTREHLRTVAAAHRTVFPRIFTIREFTRRSAGSLQSDADWTAWLERLTTTRRASNLIGDDESDDVADPYGLGRARVSSTAQELDRLTAQLARQAPW